MHISAYCDRIQYQGSLDPSIETLRGLQRAHLYSVPFENLDVALGRPLRMDEAGLVDKIVTHRRGGFCYELNGLFSRLLRALGYRVTLLNARGMNDDGSLGIDFDHMALRVACPGDPSVGYLVDVGWGNGPLEPLHLVAGDDQVQGDHTFRIDLEGSLLQLYERSEDGRWVGQYVFTLQPHDYADFNPACQYHQTSPGSIFTQKRICSRYTPEGRVTLSQSGSPGEVKLIITRDGQREERLVVGEEAVRRALKDYFDIVLDDEAGR